MSMVESPTPVPQRAPAKGRILATANDLFYEDGIRNVGVDRIISASSVTKATFYKHYRAKDNLIVEYVTARHLAVRENMNAIIARSPGAEAAVRALVAEIVDEIGRQGFRGCPFINAAAEFPDVNHPVRQIVTAHREWYTELLAGLMRDARARPARRCRRRADARTRRRDDRRIRRRPGCGIGCADPFVRTRPRRGELTQTRRGEIADPRGKGLA